MSQWESREADRKNNRVSGIAAFCVLPPICSSIWTVGCGSCVSALGLGPQPSLASCIHLVALLADHAVPAAEDSHEL
jgi:hypothetical protein